MTRPFMGRLATSVMLLVPILPVLAQREPVTELLKDTDIVRPLAVSLDGSTVLNFSVNQLSFYSERDKDVHRICSLPESLDERSKLGFWEADTAAFVGSSNDDVLIGSSRSGGLFRVTLSTDTINAWMPFRWAANDIVLNKERSLLIVGGSVGRFESPLITHPYWTTLVARALGSFHQNPNLIEHYQSLRLAANGESSEQRRLYQDNALLDENMNVYDIDLSPDETLVAAAGDCFGLRRRLVEYHEDEPGRNDEIDLDDGVRRGPVKEDVLFNERAIIRVWDIRSRQCIFAIEGLGLRGGSAESIVFVSNTMLAYLIDGERARFVDIKEGKPSTVFQDPTMLISRMLRCEPLKRLIVFTNTDAVALGMDGRMEARIKHGIAFDPRRGNIACSADGRFACVLTKDNELVLIDVPSLFARK